MALKVVTGMPMIRKASLVLLAAFALVLASPLQAQDAELGVKTRLETDATGAARVRVSLTIPADHYVYADSTKIQGVGGTRLEALELPEPKIKFDSFFEKELSIYAHSVEFLYRVSAYSNEHVQVEVAYQGCNAEICFLPEREIFDLTPGDEPLRSAPAPVQVAPVSEPPALSSGDSTWKELAEKFQIRGSTSGYLSSAQLLSFLDQAEEGIVGDASGLGRVLATRGIFITILLTLLLGLGLNLTPCVLPMIPINIAIIGAGAQAGSRTRGFALGAAYGLGITIVYGLLGVIVVYTRSKFGQLNASPWFNFGIGALFIVLALAMFDLLQIDFSRFASGKGGGSQKRGGFIAALLIGGVSALLAGACVAPALISVLVLSSDLYAKGNSAGLLLPFLLGLGMALPWPFAGAGLSFLPKPGKWMERVKQVFGVIMILFAGYYAWTGIQILRPSDTTGKVEGWHTSLAPALLESAETGQPVFIDFWATWCKSCVKMDKTTFKHAEVKTVLEDYVTLKFQAENPSAPEIKAVLDHFGAVGLPTYVVLQPSLTER